MIQVYKKQNTNFERNGDMTLTPSTATVHAVLNGSWAATIEHPIDGEGRWKFIEDNAVVKMQSFNGEQLFRIKKKEKRDSGIEAELTPIFLDAKDDCFLLDVRPTGKNGKQALDLMTAPNKKYTAMSDITTISTSYYQTKNLIEAINGEDENSFVNRWGGEILFDNYKVIVNKRVGGDYGVKVIYGKNIPEDGFSEEVNMTDVITRIVPKSYNGHMIEGEKPWVDSPLIDKYPNVRYGVIKFDDIKMIEDAQEDDEENGIVVCKTQAELKKELTKKCQEEFKKGVDKPAVSINVNMVMLQNTEMYADIKDLENVSIGDTVRCEHDKLEIVSDARVIELEWDCIAEEVIKVVLGDFQYNFFTDVSSMVNRVEEAIRPDGSVIGQQVQGIIDGVKAQLRAQSSIAKKSNTRAILFEDLDNKSDTFGAMCLGTMGFEIAYSRTADNRDWDWRTFGTGRGFFADFIVAGTMLADRIKGGTLEVGGAIGGNGVIQVYNDAGNEIGRWDKNGVNIKKGIIAGPSITLGGAGNINGTAKIMDASGNEIVRLDRSGVYAKGQYVCDASSGNKRVVIHNGQVSFGDKNGNYTGNIFALGDEGQEGIRITGGDGMLMLAKESTVLNGGYLSLSGDTLDISPKSLYVNSVASKSGTIEFSDGTFLKFRHGILVGGNTKEGAF